MKSDAYSALLKRKNQKYIFQDELDEINELVDQYLFLHTEISSKLSSLAKAPHNKEGAVYGDLRKLEDKISKILSRLAQTID